MRRSKHPEVGWDAIRIIRANGLLGKKESFIATSFILTKLQILEKNLPFSHPRKAAMFKRFNGKTGLCGAFRLILRST